MKNRDIVIIAGVAVAAYLLTRKKSSKQAKGENTIPTHLNI